MTAKDPTRPLVGELHLVTTLGDVIRCYLMHQRLTIRTLARNVSLPKSTIERWLAQKQVKYTTGASYYNLKKFARHTAIPFELLMKLSCGFPALYSVSANWFTTAFDDPSYVKGSIIRKGLFTSHMTGYATLLKVKELHLLTDDQVEWIRSRMQLYHGYEYHQENPMMFGAEVIKKAGQSLAGCNGILYDAAKVFSGHLICFPLEQTTYNDLSLAQEPWNERLITASDIADAARCDILLIYSLYGSSSQTIYVLLRRLVSYLRGPTIKRPIRLVQFATTTRAIELCKAMGMKGRFVRGAEEKSGISFPTTPLLFHLRVANEGMRWGHRGRPMRGQ